MEIAALDVPIGSVIVLELDGDEWVVWRGNDGRLGSAPRWCPHLDHDLGEGYVRGDDLVCPGHAWSFDCAGHAFKRNELGRVDPKGEVPTLVLDERHGVVVVKRA